MTHTDTVQVQQIDAYRWRIPRQGEMRVDGLVFASTALMQAIRQDQSLQQVANVAHLPGIVGHSIAMPDIHWGYGFPIGGVAAFDEHEGVISPGGIGYDINWGVRLLGSGLSRTEVENHRRELVEGLFRNIPSGVGSHRKDMRLSEPELKQVLKRGAAWAVSAGYGTARDLAHIEENGCLQGAQPDMVSARALERGRPQLGSIGSGNHFVEVDYVAEIYDERVANVLGLFPEQITVTIHTGSRGLGYQVCDDSIKLMQRATTKYGISIPDRQLCCAPLTSPEAHDYIGAMYSAANFAFANRQLITHWVRDTFEQVLQRSPKDLQLDVIYDVCHNIGKFETHVVDGQSRRLCVHRKGATRALPPGHPQIPEIYRSLGQPVLIPGDMGRYSYVLIGTPQGEETFASSCHGAGRLLSRTQAKKTAHGRPIVRELEDSGIYVRAAGRATLLEEIPEAYKDVRQVVDVVDGAGISKKVAQLRPLGVIKGWAMPGNQPHPQIYAPLSHTGDLGMLVYGHDVPALFAHAAWAMFDLMSDATLIQPRLARTMGVEGSDLEDLLVRWLSELLYLYDTQRFLYCAAAFTTLEPTRLAATVQGEPFDATRHPIDTEIKAVTYHQIAVKQVDGGWQAQVIFDL